MIIATFLAGGANFLGSYLAESAYVHDVWLPLYVEAGHSYNLSCPTRPIHCQSDSISTTRVPGAINMLGLAKRRKVRILHAFKNKPITFHGDGRQTCTLTQDDSVQHQPDVTKGKRGQVGNPWQHWKTGSRKPLPI